MISLDNCESAGLNPVYIPFGNCWLTWLSHSWTRSVMSFMQGNFMVRERSEFSESLLSLQVSDWIHLELLVEWEDSHIQVGDGGPRIFSRSGRRSQPPLCPDLSETVVSGYGLMLVFNGWWLWEAGSSLYADSPSATTWRKEYGGVGRCWEEARVRRFAFWVAMQYWIRVLSIRDMNV